MKCLLSVLACAMVISLALVGRAAYAQPVTRMAGSSRAAVHTVPPSQKLPHSPVAHYQAAPNPIVASRMISVPYGFSTPLFLNAERETVAIVGPGACTAGQQVTIDVTITQMQSAATATGQTQALCTGESDQGWSGSAHVTSGALLQPGPAQACGVATTSTEQGVTDQMQWCREVRLAGGIYLPLIQQP